MIFKFGLGDRVKDMVTGLQGIVTGRADYLNGCRCYCVKPPLDKDGKLVEGTWFDEPQLKLMKARAVVPALEWAQEDDTEEGGAKKKAAKKKRTVRRHGGGPRTDAAPER